jgi:hypothetical protein
VPIDLYLILPPLSNIRPLPSLLGLNAAHTLAVCPHVASKMQPSRQPRADAILADFVKDVANSKERMQAWTELATSRQQKDSVQMQQRTDIELKRALTEAWRQLQSTANEKVKAHKHTTDTLNGERSERAARRSVDLELRRKGEAHLVRGLERDIKAYKHQQVDIARGRLRTSEAAHRAALEECHSPATWLRPDVNAGTGGHGQRSSGPQAYSKFWR